MRMMVAFEKSAALRYVGHLDLMRTIQRALRRSGLPIKYSNGFNPHIRLSFAAPLSVGVAGKREMMEVPVEDGVEENDFLLKLNQVLPPSLTMVFARKIDDQFPTLMSLMAGSEYSITLPRSPETDAALSQLEAFMTLKEYVTDRRTKSGESPCDIRPFVKDARAETTPEEHRIFLTTLCNQAGALKPSLWLKSLFLFAGQEPVDSVIYRERMLALSPEGKLIPMEAYPNG